MTKVLVLPLLITARLSMWSPKPPWICFGRRECRRKDFMQSAMLRYV